MFSGCVQHVSIYYWVSGTPNPSRHYRLHYINCVLVSEREGMWVCVFVLRALYLSNWYCWCDERPTLMYASRTTLNGEHCKQYSDWIAEWNCAIWLHSTEAQFYVSLKLLNCHVSRNTVCYFGVVGALWWLVMLSPLQFYNRSGPLFDGSVSHCVRIRQCAREYVRHPIRV